MRGPVVSARTGSQCEDLRTGSQCEDLRTGSQCEDLRTGSQCHHLCTIPESPTQFSSLSRSML